MSSSEPIRLIFILDDFPGLGAGTEGQFWLLLRGLDRARVMPAIILLRPSVFLQREVIDVPLRVLNIERLRSLRSLCRILGAAWWARREGFQVAHIFFNDSAMVFPPVLKLLGIKVIVSRRDLGFWYTSRNLRVLRFSNRFVDAVVANCAAVRDAVLGAEQCPSEKVEVIYNGVRRILGPSCTKGRRAFGVPEEVPLIVLVANLRPLKRVGDAIRALAEVDCYAGNAPHLLVVGEDRDSAGAASHLAELKEIARDLCVNDRVHFAGKVEDPMPAISLADVCLLCSETEGLSNVVIEYMLAGKPVVCTAVGGNSEIVLDGRTGRLVPVGSIGKLAAALNEILNDPVLARTWGELARKRATKLFNSAEMVEQHQQLYAKLLGSAPVINAPDRLE